ncbi:unnamed protein product, partial [Effrenium voratum]
ARLSERPVVPKVNLQALQVRAEVRERTEGDQPSSRMARSEPVADVRSQDPPQNPRAPSFRVPWRAAGALALVLGLLAMPTVYRSLRSSGLSDISEDTWHALEAELEGKQLPTLQLAHFTETAGHVLCTADIAQSVARLMGIGAFSQVVSKVCDFETIKRVSKRLPNQQEKERCAGFIFGIIFQVELGAGVIAASISTCSGSLNVPANCAANIGAFTGGLGVLLQSTLVYDANCLNKGKTPMDIIDAEERRS